MNLFDPPPETVAMVDHAMQSRCRAHHSVTELAPTVLATTTTSYPVLVLAGPAAVWCYGSVYPLSRLLRVHTDAEFCFMVYFSIVSHCTTYLLAWFMKRFVSVGTVLYTTPRFVYWDDCV